MHGMVYFIATLADYLQQEGYATKLVGKWHLGSRPGYLPIDRGFDEWFGIPYHMSGGSLDSHVCGKERDPNGTLWLPLFDGRDIVEQPVDLSNLAPRYVEEARQFILENASNQQPFFLYWHSLMYINCVRLDLQSANGPHLILVEMVDLMLLMGMLWKRWIGF